MVSRIYTPNVLPYYRPLQGGVVKFGPESSPQAGQETPRFDPDESKRNQQQSGGFSSVAEMARANRIGVGSIIQDFRSTLDALGADDPLRGEVEAYLKIVDLQSRKPMPAVSLMKQTFRAAADSMDGFITKALSQPSKVVRDWVEALLLQNIDFQQSDVTPVQTAKEVSETPAASSQALPENQPATTDSQIVNENALSDLEKQHLKTVIAEGKNALRTGAYGEAITMLQSGMILVDGKNRPDLEGNLSLMMGRAADKANRFEEAALYYQKASEKFETAGLTAKQAKSTFALAGLYDEHGKLNEARTQYEAALALDKTLGDPVMTGQTLSELGSVYYRLGEYDQAELILRQANRELTSVQADHPLLMDVTSRLGNVFQANGDYRQAAGAFKKTLALAQTHQDKAFYSLTLEDLASVYEAAGKTEKADSVYQQMAKLAG